MKRKERAGTIKFDKLLVNRQISRQVDRAHPTLDADGL